MATRSTNCSSTLQRFDPAEFPLPRITQPILLKTDVADMDPADLVQLGTKVINFLLPKAARAESPTA